MVWDRLWVVTFKWRYINSRRYINSQDRWVDILEYQAQQRSSLLCGKKSGAKHNQTHILEPCVNALFYDYSQKK